MIYYTITFTGGPCGGKTDIINLVANNLREMGFNVILVPETARPLMASGIKSRPDDNKYTLWFQDSIIKLQSLKEKIAEEAEPEILNTTIILYDRAIPDNFAYLNNYEDYKNLLERNNLSELNVIDKYDLIINLSSLTNFPGFDYKKDSERTENDEYAKIIDYKTTTSYLLSRNLKMIYPTKKLEDKLSIVLKYIYDLINCNQKKEVIRYKVNNNESNFYVYNNDNSRMVNIEKTYLSSKCNDRKYILNKRIYNNEISYVLDAIEGDEDNYTIYNSRVINEYSYNMLLNKYFIVKEESVNELSFVYDCKVYKVVFYTNGETILEIEKTNFIDEIKIPDNIKIYKNLEKTLRLC